MIFMKPSTKIFKNGANIIVIFDLFFLINFGAKCDLMPNETLNCSIKKRSVKVFMCVNQVQNRQETIVINYYC